MSGRVMDKRTQANLKVKKQITDALFALMHDKRIEDITVTELIRTAGVARSSFYRNYTSKPQVVTALTEDILRRFLDGRDAAEIDCMTYSHVRHSFEFFKEYGKYALDMYRSGFAALLIDELNKFHEAVAGEMSAKSVDRYTVYMYIGAMVDTALKWLECGAQESVDDIAAVFCEFMGIEMA